MTVFFAETLFPLLLVAAAIGDLLTSKIPNWLTATMVVLFFPLAFATGLPMKNMLWQCAVAAMVLVASFEIYAAGLWGGGDAKLLGAAALWFGWPTLAQFAIYTVLAGGTLAGAVVLWNIMHIDQEVRGHTWMTRWTNINAKIPYAVAFAIGGMLAFPGTWWMNLR
jgi:prepilin peptidase CpaA